MKAHSAKASGSSHFKEHERSKSHAFVRENVVFVYGEFKKQTFYMCNAVYYDFDLKSVTSKLIEKKIHRSGIYVFSYEM